jgi:hypothetical protein
MSKKKSTYSTLTKKIAICKEEGIKKKEIFNKSYFGEIKIKEEEKERQQNKN